ncbi:DUF927 domain-containing protein [Chitinilyticum litopenaei]|uniref:DUF927 domain-containing protein n=1 Tax=Chitinilyticum litopenaei TaxID=1121276 RepID=UPI00130D7795|nr:DUF927 domain-containing protein [Chitinilyticum litopenaei]
MNVEPGRDDLQTLLNPEAVPAFKPGGTAPQKSTSEKKPANEATATGKPEKRKAQTVKAGAGQYRAKADGVYYRSGEDDEGDGRKLCGPLFIIGLARDFAGLGWSVVVRLADLDGNEKQHLIPRGKLVSQDSTRVLEELAELGLWISTANDAKKLLLQYLASGVDGQRLRLVKATGWHDGRFVLPDEVIGDAGEEPVIYQGRAKTPIASAGTVAAWRDGIARYAVGNPLLMLSICSGFAGPLLRFAGMDTGGFHIFGDSKDGKSTVCYMAASLWGNPEDYKLSWTATENGLESAATVYNDLPFLLDELGQAGKKIDVGAVVYSLSQSKGKTRSSDVGALRDHARWSCFVLSTGEPSIQAYIEKNGGKVSAGQLVRFIELNTGQGRGTWPELHGFASYHPLCTHLRDTAKAQHGAAGVAWLQGLVSIPRHELEESIKAAMQRFAHQYVPEGASAQVTHAAGYFALAAFAGDLAAHLGLTGWPAGDPQRAAGELFRGWVRGRGGAGSEEDRQILEQVRLHFTIHGEARYSRIGEDPSAVDKDAPRTLSRCGWREVNPVNPEGLKDKDSSYTETTYYVQADAWAKEVLAGVDTRRANKLLASLGILKTDASGKYSCNKRMPGHKLIRVYVVLPTLFSGDFLPADDDGAEI